MPRFKETPVLYLNKAELSINFMKPENKKCSESCGCDSANNVKKDEPEKLEIKSEEKSAEIKLDPTHFGDWQINGRAIDF